MKNYIKAKDIDKFGKIIWTNEESLLRNQRCKKYLLVVGMYSKQWRKWNII